MSQIRILPHLFNITQIYAGFVLLISLLYFSVLLACNIVSCFHGDSNWFLSTVLQAFPRFIQYILVVVIFIFVGYTTFSCKQRLVSKTIQGCTIPKYLGWFRTGSWPPKQAQSAHIRMSKSCRTSGFGNRQENKSASWQYKMFQLPNECSWTRSENKTLWCLKWERKMPERKWMRLCVIHTTIPVSSSLLFYVPLNDSLHNSLWTLELMFSYAVPALPWGRVGWLPIMEDHRYWIWNGLERERERHHLVFHLR